MNVSDPPGPQLKGPVFERLPEGDDRPRLMCADCGFVNYVNPRIIAATVPVWDGKVLLARRAINPRRNYWTVPAGFLEVGETVEAGAVRETWEEAQARVVTEGLLGIYNIAAIGQIYMVYRARMLSLDFAAGPESLEVMLFPWSEIPWAELAFPSVRWALQDYKKVEGQNNFPPFTEPPEIHWQR